MVTKSSYTSGNGKYVKIRHNSTYETQYLHMSKRAVKKGQRVKQGEVIGYVGQTGSPQDLTCVSASGNMANRSITFERTFLLLTPSPRTCKALLPFKCPRMRPLPRNSSPTRPWPPSNLELNAVCRLEHVSPNGQAQFL